MAITAEACILPATLGRHGSHLVCFLFCCSFGGSGHFRSGEVVGQRTSTASECKHRYRFSRQQSRFGEQASRRIWGIQITCILISRWNRGSTIHIYYYLASPFHFCQNGVYNFSVEFSPNVTMYRLNVGGRRNSCLQWSGKCLFFPQPTTAKFFLYIKCTLLKLLV